jgi:hypothetical protein
MAGQTTQIPQGFVEASFQKNPLAGLQEYTYVQYMLNVGLYFAQTTTFWFSEIHATCAC